MSRISANGPCQKPGSLAREVALAVTNAILDHSLKPGTKLCEQALAEVFGVSTDSVYVHKAWHDTSPTIKTVSFPLVADPTGKLSREFGTYVEDQGVTLRGSFIIDPDGVVKAYEIHDNSIGRSGQELLRKLQAAIHVHEGNGEVCPANWKPGGKTLKPSLNLVGKL